MKKEILHIRFSVALRKEVFFLLYSTTFNAENKFSIINYTKMLLGKEKKTV